MTTALAEKHETTGENALAKEKTVCSTTPPVDIFETENELFIQLDMPGVTQKDIDIQIEQGMLQVTAMRDGGEGRGAVRYERTFRVRETIEDSGIAASYRDGVLSLQLPKRETARQRKIEVKRG